MSDEQHIPTVAVQKAVRGRETEVLKALNIAWDDGAKHLLDCLADELERRR